MSHVTEPTLASIPRILFRTVMRLVARGVFMLAAAALLIGLTLIACSVLLNTWRSPRTPRAQALIGLALAAQKAYETFRRENQSVPN